MSFGNYDDIIAAIVAGQKYTAIWQKLATTTILGGVVGNTWYHMWPVAGYPVPGTYAGTNLQWTPTNELTTGALAHGGNVSPSAKYVTYVSIFNSVGGAQIPLFVDMVGYYPLTESSSVQSFDNVTNGAPDRYCGAGLCGLQMMIVATGLIPNAGNQIAVSITYVNQDGVIGRVTPSASMPTLRLNSAAPTQSMGAVVPLSISGGSPFFPLASGDMGVRSVTNITFNAAVLQSGNLALVLCKPLFYFGGGQYCQDRDLITQRLSMERIYDGACISMIVNAMDNGPFFFGALDFIWG